MANPSSEIQVIVNGQHYRDDTKDHFNDMNSELGRAYQYYYFVSSIVMEKETERLAKLVKAQMDHPMMDQDQFDKMIMKHRLNLRSVNKQALTRLKETKKRLGIF